MLVLEFKHCLASDRCIDIPRAIVSLLHCNLGCGWETLPGDVAHSKFSRPPLHSKCRLDSYRIHSTSSREKLSTKLRWLSPCSPQYKVCRYFFWLSLGRCLEPENKLVGIRQVCLSRTAFRHSVIVVHVHTLRCKVLFGN